VCPAGLTERLTEERGDFSSIEWAHPEIEFVIADAPCPAAATGVAGMTSTSRRSDPGVECDADALAHCRSGATVAGLSNRLVASSEPVRCQRSSGVRSSRAPHAEHTFLSISRPSALGPMILPSEPLPSCTGGTSWLQLGHEYLPMLVGLPRFRASPTSLDVCTNAPDTNLRGDSALES
jgi:hypothetical protein